jgi:hypothetical protein
LHESSDKKRSPPADEGGQEGRVFSFRRKGAAAASPNTHRSRNSASRHHFGWSYRYSPW